MFVTIAQQSVKRLRVAYIEQTMQSMAESFGKSSLPRLRWHEQFWFIFAIPLLWIAAIHIATRIYWLTHPTEMHKSS